MREGSCSSLKALRDLVGDLLGGFVFDVDDEVGGEVVIVGAGGEDGLDFSELSGVGGEVGAVV